MLKEIIKQYRLIFATSNKGNNVYRWNDETKQVEVVEITAENKEAIYSQIRVIIRL